MRGSRVQAVVNELQGEKIDIIPMVAGHRDLRLPQDFIETVRGLELEHPHLVPEDHMAQLAQFEAYPAGPPGPSF